MNKKLAITALVFGAFALSTIEASATTNLMFILDSSGSMWGKVDEQTKIETAKTALSNLLSDLPQDTNMGLMVYGHRQEKDCKDVETVMPVGSANKNSIAEALSKVQPRGRTPLAYSLERSATAFGGREKDNNHVVLISDGIETCEGDPCAAATKLAAAGINVKVHVVGFDISAKDRAHLQCIADNGGGKYFDAKSSTDLKNIIKKLPQQVQAPPPPAPPKPKWKVVFQDNFDGNELAEHWTVKNPNPEAMIMENGELTLLSAAKGILNKNENNIANMLVLDRPLPKGDWRITMRYRLEVGTLSGWAALGLFKDPANRLQVFTNASDDWYGSMYLRSLKLSAGSATGNDKVFFRPKGLSGSIAFVNQMIKDGAELQLIKKGRSYIPQARLVRRNPEEPKPWISLPKLTSLKPIGPVFIAFTKGKGAGEDLIHIDWIKIEELTMEKAAVQPEQDTAQAKPSAAPPATAAPAPSAGGLDGLFDGYVGTPASGKPSKGKALVDFLDKKMSKQVYLDLSLSEKQTKSLVENAFKDERGITRRSFSVLSNWDNWRDGGHEIMFHLASGETFPIETVKRGRLVGQFQVVNYVGPHQGFFSFILKPAKLSN
jgi:Mg-chelatase subunit ChlD